MSKYEEYIKELEQVLVNDKLARDKFSELEILLDKSNIGAEFGKARYEVITHAKYYLMLDYLNENGLIPNNVAPYYLKENYQNYEDYKSIMKVIPKDFFKNVDFRYCILDSKNYNNEVIWALKQITGFSAYDFNEFIPTIEGNTTILNFLNLKKLPAVAEDELIKIKDLIHGIEVYKSYSLLSLSDKKELLKKYERSKLLNSELYIQSLNLNYNFKDLIDDYLRNYSKNPDEYLRVNLEEVQQVLSLKTAELLKKEKEIDSYDNDQALRALMEMSSNINVYQEIENYKSNKLKNEFISTLEGDSDFELDDVLTKLNQQSENKLNGLIFQFDALKDKYLYFQSDEYKYCERIYDEYEKCKLQYDKLANNYTAEKGMAHRALIEAEKKLEELDSIIPFDKIGLNSELFKGVYGRNIRKYKEVVYQNSKIEFIRLEARIKEQDIINDMIDVDSEIKQIDSLISKVATRGVSKDYIPIESVHEDVLSNLFEQKAEESSQNSPKTM